MNKKFLIGLILGMLSATPVGATIYSVGLDKSQYTSDFMMGNVVVSVIFVESDGGMDPNIENWTDDRKTQVMTKIMSGLDWWTQQNPRAKLTFTYVTQTKTTKYEPITRPYYDEALWIPEIMTKLGYSGSRFASTRSYDNDLRNNYGGDWAYTIFVVDSLIDSNGKFADGYFAYSYLGGPYTVMTYDNNGYGIANMDVVIAHETGHIFNALDEYAGASSPNTYSNGYFPTINGNHEYSGLANDNTSIMRGGLRWGLDSWAKLMVGWRDLDNNGREDIVDQNPVITVSQPQNLSNATGFTGTARIKVLPRQSNASGYGFTVDSIHDIEYRLRNNEWGEAVAADGNFDSAEEAFQISVPASQMALMGSQSALSSTDLDVRVVTAYSNGYVDASAVSADGTLNYAHAYPNPYKPNSGLGHNTFVTFDNLTVGSKVQVFSAAGEPVFEKSSDSGSLVWDTVEQAHSGVYFFLISDENGHKKKGKIAIIK